MGNWGSENFAGTSGGSLQQVIDQFPSKLKQAMFAAASRGPIARRTWNNCAMNAAGFEVGTTKEVRSLATAAEAFSIPESLVQRFITIWDGMIGTDEDCTQKLRASIEESGLFTEPHEKKHGAVRVVSVKVFEQKLADFHEAIENFQVPDEDVALDILDGTLAGV